MTTRFELGHAWGLFGIASNFNHACHGVRNAEYAFDHERNIMVFTATDDIAAGQEVLISYNRYRHILKSQFGFICHCGACKDFPYQQES